MTLVRQMPNAANRVDSAGVQVLITGGEVWTALENPEKVMEKIQVRATLVGAILEEILLEPHDEQWEQAD